MTETRIYSTGEQELAATPAAIFFRPQFAAPYFVASRNFSQTRRGNATQVTVEPILQGALFYYWYLDGQFVGKTSAPNRTLILTAGDQSRIDVLQTLDPSFDAQAHAPAGYSARRTLRFIRSIDPTTARYRIEQQIGAGSWTILGYVAHKDRQWDYSFLAPRLTDLTSYSWRVIPINAAGDDGTALSLGSEYIVRTPDAPDFAITFDAVNDQVNFAEAS